MGVSTHLVVGQIQCHAERSEESSFDDKEKGEAIQVKKTSAFLAMILFCGALVCLGARSGFATSCGHLTEQEHKERYTIQFRGEAVSQRVDDDSDSSRPNTYTTFKVISVYRGDIGDSIEIYQARDPHGDIPLTVGREYIIWTGENLRIAYCDRFSDLTSLKEAKNGYGYGWGGGGLLQLEMTKAKAGARNKDEEIAVQLEVWERIFADFGRSGSARQALYDYKSQLLQSYGRDNEALLAYTHLLKEGYEAAQETAQKYFEDLSRRGVKQRPGVADELADRCDGLAPVTASTPDFLRPFPAVPSARHFNVGGRERLVRYATLLFQTGNYETALRAACYAAGKRGGMNYDVGADSLKALLLIKLGRDKEAGEGPFDFSKLPLNELVLDGVSMRHSNFSGLRLKKLVIRNADLTGAVFRDLVAENVEITDSNLSHAWFSGAKINSGKVKGGDFSFVSFACASATFDSFAATSLYGVDFAGSRFSPANSGFPPASDDPTACTPRQAADTEKEEFYDLWRLPELPADSEVHAIMIDSAMSRAARPVWPVKVRNAGKPLVLVIEGKGAVNWVLEVEEGADLRLVVLKGNEVQDISGVPPKVRIINLSQHFLARPGLGRFAVHDPQEFLKKAPATVQTWDSPMEAFIVPGVPGKSALELAAENGDATAQYSLGENLHTGSHDLYQKDSARALGWYMKAAKAGQVDAQLALGLMLEEGNGVKQDLAEGKKWIALSKSAKFEKTRKDAETGKPWDQCNMGYFYRDGSGMGYPGTIEPDYAEAMRWFQKAAVGGDWGGMIGIAGLYRDGLGVKQDYAAAAQWLRKAAEEGSAVALLRMARLHATWKGPGNTDAETYFWMKAAAGRMDNIPKVYKDALDKAKNRLDGDSADAIEKKVAGWLKDHPLRSPPHGTMYMATRKMIQDRDLDGNTAMFAKDFEELGSPKLIIDSQMLKFPVKK